MKHLIILACFLNIAAIFLINHGSSINSCRRPSIGSFWIRDNNLSGKAGKKGVKPWLKGFLQKLKKVITGKPY